MHAGALTSMVRARRLETGDSRAQLLDGADLHSLLQQQQHQQQKGSLMGSQATIGDSRPNQQQQPISVTELIRQERNRQSLKVHRPLRQRLWTLLMLIASLLVIGGAFSLLFLVPIVIDPAVATIKADIHPRPVLCRTVRVDRLVSLPNCTWSSCREGCTSDLYHCTHVYVSFRVPTEFNSTRESITSRRPPVSSSAPVTQREQHATQQLAPLLVNVKTCGYPPRINCSRFEQTYAVEGEQFHCFFSRTNSQVVITDFQPGEADHIMTSALSIPLAAIAGGVMTIFTLQLGSVLWTRYVRAASSKNDKLDEANTANTNNRQPVWSTCAENTAGPIVLNTTSSHSTQLNYSSAGRTRALSIWSPPLPSSQLIELKVVNQQREGPDQSVT